MGCGATKSANVRGDTSTDELEVISSSITQIRDLAPLEVADTGAHPPRRDGPIRSLYFQSGTGASNPALPGVIPESLFDAEMDLSASRKSESLIKMHPPKKPQRLGEDLEILKTKTVLNESKNPVTFQTSRDTDSSYLLDPIAIVKPWAR
ncbi:hypothetical protein X975_21265, partial [Stegodyphus mimosarum]